MNESDIERLLEASRRRARAPREPGELEAWPPTHPEARPGWAEEIALDQVLAALPDAPLSPQFTQRVLAAVESFDPAASQVPVGGWPAALRGLFLGWRGAAIGAAIGAVLVALAIGFPAHQRAQARARLAESVAAMSALAEWPNLEALAEFEVVYHLPSGPLLNEADLAQAFE